MLELGRPPEIAVVVVVRFHGRRGGGLPEGPADAIPRLDRLAHPRVTEYPTSIPCSAVCVQLRKLQEVARGESRAASHVRVADGRQHDRIATHLERHADELPRQIRE